MKRYLFFTLLLFFPITSNATEFIKQSEFDNAQTEIKFSLLLHQIQNQKQQATESGEITYSEGTTETKDVSYKSPGKAFVMSLLIPGWGQHYNGSSKLKSFAFLGTEVASWVLYVKWHGDAGDLTDVYEAFNDAHWIASRYDSMLAWTYPDRDTNPGLYPELSHHLPETKVQQYYEMTGKYDQFSWGWDDAMILSDSSTYADYSANFPFEYVNTSATVPFSANRNTYETMRDDANNKYSQARKMVYVSMLNRIFSSFEAMFTAKKNNKNSGSSSMLSSISAEASFQSIYVKRDTPYITLSMKF